MLPNILSLSKPRPELDEGGRRKLLIAESVARNLADRGHYGRRLDGQLAPPGPEAAFPVTAHFWSYRYEQL